MSKLWMTVGLLLVAPGVWAGDAAPGAANGAGSAQAVQQALLSDPHAVEQILTLQDDPSVQAVLQDPALMQAVQAGDLSTLARDPRIQALMENPTVRSLGSGMKR